MFCCAHLVPKTSDKMNLQEEKTQIIVMARVIAIPEKRAFIIEELEKLIPPTRAEEGNIDYKLHQDKEDENTFVFFEHWKTQESIDKHLKSDHFLNWVKVSEGSVKSAVIHQLKRLA
eukprot:Filipodium_phascolosomae@DN2315_c0_g1_i2.p1